MYEKYVSAQFKMTTSYRQYYSWIPEFLHNRPRSVITHSLQRIKTVKKTTIVNQTFKHWTRRRDSLPSKVSLGEYAHYISVTVQKHHLAHVKIGLRTIYLASTFLQFSISRKAGLGINYQKITSIHHD